MRLNVRFVVFRLEFQVVNGHEPFLYPVQKLYTELPLLWLTCLAVGQLSEVSCTG